MTDLVARVLGQRVFAVHRLDEETTGAMVFALDEATKAALEDMFRAHTIERDYLALLSSAPSPAACRGFRRSGACGSLRRPASRDPL
jgi:23S rRNA-/tRNA-specific pseudouridylate synthase